MRNEETMVSSIPLSQGTGDEHLIIDVCRQVSSAKDQRDAAKKLIYHLYRQQPALLGATFFYLDARSQTLLPLAMQRFNGSRDKYKISSKLMHKACQEKRVVWSAPPPETETSQYLICHAPMVFGGAATGLMYLEFHNLSQAEAKSFVRRVGIILELCAPAIELFTSQGGDTTAMMKMAQSINASIEAKDTYTSGHSERVAVFSDILAEHLGMDAQQRQLLYVSALCHDVGKIGVSDLILRKPSLLSSEEYVEMQSHPTVGAKIIQELPGSEMILGGIKYHHERWDGTGYPHNLQGKEIPLFARIIAVTDAFDAMTSGRAYSGYVEQERAVQHLRSCVDLFDPEILNALDTAHESGSLTRRTGTQTQNALNI